MTSTATQDYQHAVEEAANAFMKVMTLRGFQVRDYPQNFVKQMAHQTQLAFEVNRHGAHQNADHLVSELLRAAPVVATVSRLPAKAKAAAFPALRRHLA